MDLQMTPFMAGVGMFVDFAKVDFVGKVALEKADRRCLLFGLRCETAVPAAGMEVLAGDVAVGAMTAGGWSPTLEKGIGYVRFQAPSASQESWLGQTLTLRDRDGQDHVCEVVALPFFDAEKRLPRGLA
jgi:aminomethyltransferase